MQRHELQIGYVMIVDLNGISWKSGVSPRKIGISWRYIIPIVGDITKYIPQPTVHEFGVSENGGWTPKKKCIFIGNMMMNWVILVAILCTKPTEGSILCRPWATFLTLKTCPLGIIAIHWGNPYQTVVIKGGYRVMSWNGFHYRCFFCT